MRQMVHIKQKIFKKHHLDHCGVVIRNFPLKSGHGFADYIFYVNGKAAGVIEAKKRINTNRCRDSVFAKRGGHHCAQSELYITL